MQSQLFFRKNPLILELLQETILWRGIISLTEMLNQTNLCIPTVFRKCGKIKSFRFQFWLSIVSSKKKKSKDPPPMICGRAKILLVNIIVGTVLWYKISWYITFSSETLSLILSRDYYYTTCLFFFLLTSIILLVFFHSWNNSSYKVNYLHIS